MTREEKAILVVLLIAIVSVVGFVVGVQAFLGNASLQDRGYGGGGDEKQYASHAYPYQFTFPNSHNSGP